MGRPVGGASAVGCGIFGVAGILVSVGLVVWLGSRVTTSVDGNTSSRKERTASSVPSDLGHVADVAGQQPLGLEPQGAVIRVKAPKDLGDGGSVTVTGTDLAAGPIEVTICLTSTVGDGASSSCDATTTVEATVADAGTLSQPLAAPRVITVGGTAYDCAARAGACSVLGYRVDNPLETGISAPLTFAGGLPPVDGAEPPPAG